MIRQFAERLAQELAFDASLASRVRHEVEDHLLAAVESDRGEDRLVAEARAVARFGDARAIAAQFAVASLARQARGLGVAGVVLIAAVFFAMKARLAWYAVAALPLAEELRTLAGVVLEIDRYAFWLAGCAALAAWLYIGSRRVPVDFTAEYQRELRRFTVLCSAAAGALLVSVASDVVLTSLRLVGRPWSLAFLVPLFSVAVELSCSVALLAYFRRMRERVACTLRMSERV